MNFMKKITGIVLVSALSLAVLAGCTRSTGGTVSTGGVITAVAQNPDAIGYASLASLSDSVKALSVEGVAPSEETVRDGSYPIQRPFVLVTKTDTALSEAAQAFFDFATSPDAAELISKAGAVAVH